MNKDELKAKYARIATDRSQLEQFKNDLIDGNDISIVPAPAAEDAGKALVVDETGQLAYGEGGGGSGGTQLYKHELSWDNPDIPYTSKAVRMIVYNTSDVLITPATLESAYQNAISVKYIPTIPGPSSYNLYTERFSSNLPDTGIKMYEGGTVKLFKFSLYLTLDHQHDRIVTYYTTNAVSIIDATNADFDNTTYSTEFTDIVTPL